MSENFLVIFYRKDSDSFLSLGPFECVSSDGECLYGDSEQPIARYGDFAWRTAHHNWDGYRLVPTDHTKEP